MGRLRASARVSAQNWSKSAGSSRSGRYVRSSSSGRSKNATHPPRQLVAVGGRIRRLPSGRSVGRTAGNGVGVRTAARGSRDGQGPAAGTCPRDSSRRIRRAVAATSCGRQQLAQLVAERRRPDRRRGFAGVAISSAVRRSAPPAPEDRPQLRVGREADAVVDAVHVAACHRQHVAALPVRVVDHRVEQRHPSQRRVAPRMQVDDVDRFVDVDPELHHPGAERVRRAGSSAARCSSRSPAIPGRRPPRDSRACRRGSRRGGARRGSACRRTPRRGRVPGPGSAASRCSRGSGSRRRPAGRRSPCRRS